MLLPEQVKEMIAQVLPCEHLEVEGDGHHFFAQIVSSAFEGKARLARHRLVKDGLTGVTLLNAGEQIAQDGLGHSYLL